MFKHLDSRVDADIVCDDDKTLVQLRTNLTPLTAEDLSPVFDLAEIMKVSQVVCKSFSD